MPGVKSLEAQQYYAHPRNAFWPIMAQLCDFDIAESYAKRSARLIQSGVCVWDVLYDCDRQGSLDSCIQKHSEQPNDFMAFFKQQATLSRVAFNGQAARKIFHRHFKHLYDLLPDIKWVDLPSTSPAHASMTLAEKTQLWSSGLQLNVVKNER